MFSFIQDHIWRVYILILGSVLAIYSIFKLLPDIQLKKPDINDHRLIDLPVSYYKGMETYSDKTIYQDGLLDMNNGDKKTRIGFELRDCVRSVQGYCKLTDGTVEFNGQSIEIKGGSDDVWPKVISYKYADELAEKASPCTYEIPVSLTAEDLHKTISFNVRLNVVYPLKDAGGFFDKGEVCSKQFNVYIISYEEMLLRKSYTRWLNRGFHITFFVLMLSLTLVVFGFGTGLIKLSRFKRAG